MAGSEATLHLSPAGALSGTPLNLTLNNTPLRLLVTATDLYQQETAPLSGFISFNDNITPNAVLTLTHPFDPLFLLLPALLVKQDKFRELGELAEECGCSAVLQCSRLYASLPRICDQKTHAECTYFRLNQQLLQSWLLTKFQRLAGDIGAAVPVFGGEEVSIQAKVLQKILPQELFLRLLEWTEIPQDTIDTICCPPLKRTADSLPSGPSSKQSKPVKTTKAPAPPKDMKPITGFFKPKN